MCEYYIVMLFIQFIFAYYLRLCLACQNENLFPIPVDVQLASPSSSLQGIDWASSSLLLLRSSVACSVPQPSKFRHLSWLAISDNTHHQVQTASSEGVSTYWLYLSSSFIHLFFNPYHQYCNSIFLFFLSQCPACWNMMPLEETAPATTASGIDRKSVV